MNTPGCDTVIRHTHPMTHAEPAGTKPRVAPGEVDGDRDGGPAQQMKAG